MQETPSDPSLPFVAKDLYEYENLAAFLLDRPAQSKRNHHIRSYRANGYRPEAVEAYARGFDAKAAGEFCIPSGGIFNSAHIEGIEAAEAVGGFWDDLVPEEDQSTAIKPLFTHSLFKNAPISASDFGVIRINTIC